MNPIQLKQFIHRVLDEDLGAGDITSAPLVEETHQSSCLLIMKQPGIVAGLHIAELVFKELDTHANFISLVQEGDFVEEGTVIARIIGLTRAILAGERVALNLLQRMSGIATTTRGLVDKLKGLNCHVLDTRKTTPGLRQLEKYAVRIGGGLNHRFGLSHGVMLKDNHIALVGSITEAVRRVRDQVGHMVQIEVEADTLEQVREILTLDVDAILLDNMDTDTLRAAVALIDGKVWTEASGGVAPHTIRTVAETGVNAISMGWLTHSVKVIDISLDFEKNQEGLQ